MILAIIAASGCIATATTPNPDLKKDFESKACSEEGLLKATLFQDGDSLEITMTVDMDRTKIDPNPMHTVSAANTAQNVFGYLGKSFKLVPSTFQWTVADMNGKYMCSIRIEDGDEVSGDCSGVGKK